MSERYAPCRMCENPIRHKTVTIPGSKPVEIKVCPICDRYKCPKCRLPVPVEHTNCPDCSGRKKENVA